MRIIRRLFALLLVPMLASCDDAGLSPRELVGQWRFSTETTAIEWRRDDVRLWLGEDGAFVRTYRIFALDGRPEDLLRSSTREEGTYRVHGDSLVLEPSGVERWAADQQQPVEQPSAFLGERYRVRLVGDRLLLEEERLVEGQPMTYHHTFRRADDTDDPRMPRR